MDPSLPGVTTPSSELDQSLRAALAAKPAGYQPRTHHFEASGAPKFVNRLIQQTSPYLLQHAHNPVNWYPWGDEAFARAKAEGKPVLLSVGYSTCHWCHVMERESFEDLEVAQAINERFIAIKVDREERPDVDATYMTAVQLLTGRGGWPMTVALTPDKQPFFGGTYFPARDGDRGGGKGFLTLVKELHVAWSTRREAVLSAAKELSGHVAEAQVPQAPAAVPGPELLHAVARSLVDSLDTEWGGFGRAPKFPRPVTLDFLLRYHRRSGDAAALSAVTLTLSRMASGGMNDQLGHGFHRYSTDIKWLVPHFEKMLYDNAQLVPVYLSAWQLTGRDDFRAVARQTLDYVAREMTTKDGAFYSATDADSRTPDGHEEEGYCFTWTPSELDAALGQADGALAKSLYGVEGTAHLDGRWVLHRPDDDAAAAKRLGLSIDALATARSRIDAKLLAVRATRPPPHLDDKVLTSWNALMISAFARAGLALGEPKDVARAAKAADFLLTHLKDAQGRLLRSYREGAARVPAFLDDSAFLVQALIDLFEATGEARWLEAALAQQQQQDQSFADDVHGGYFMTPNGHEALLTRERPSSDGAEPSGNAVAMLNLHRLHTLTGQDAFRTRLNAGLEGFAGTLRHMPSASPLLLSAVEASLDSPVEVFIVTQAAGDDASALLAALRRAYLPNRAVVQAHEGAQDILRLVPALEGRGAQKGLPTAYVCERGACELPATDAATFARQLAKVRRPLTRDAK